MFICIHICVNVCSYVRVCRCLCMGLEARKGSSILLCHSLPIPSRKGLPGAWSSHFLCQARSQQAPIFLLSLPPSELELHSSVYCISWCTLDVQFVCGCWDLNSVEQEVVTSGLSSLHPLFCTHLNQVFVADCYEFLVWRFTE